MKHGERAVVALLGPSQGVLAVGQNPEPLVNIKLGGKWMFIHPKMEP